MTLDPSISDIEGRPTIRLERDLPHDIDRVWRAVSEPAEMERWFVSVVAWTPCVGETIEAYGQEVRVTQVDEPRVLAWEWGDERYRIELAPTAMGTHLTFSHAFTEEYGPGEQHALGWQVYLGRLDTVLLDRDVDELAAHAQALVLEDEDTGRPVVRFIRRLEHPIERVWDSVTTTRGLRAWFPTAVELDLRPGGRATFGAESDVQLTGEVLELEPPRRIGFSWGEDRIRVDLLPVQGGSTTWLTFTHVLSTAADAVSRTAAGWHVCLDALARGLADPDAEPVEAGRTDEWQAHYEAYLARGYPAGAPIPAG